MRINSDYLKNGMYGMMVQLVRAFEMTGLEEVDDAHYGVKPKKLENVSMWQTRQQKEQCRNFKREFAEQRREWVEQSMSEEKPKNDICDSENHATKKFNFKKRNGLHKSGKIGWDSSDQKGWRRRNTNKLNFEEDLPLE